MVPLEATRGRRRAHRRGLTEVRAATSKTPVATVKPRFRSFGRRRFAGGPILRAFGEGWGTTNLDTNRPVSHPLQRTHRTRISYCAVPAMAACAAFFKENRMRF